MNSGGVLAAETSGDILCGYRLPGFGHGCVATYIPEFRHVWTNPRYPHAALQQVLNEEFIHATQTGFRPAELLPLLNYLRNSADHPRHEEFRDIIEPVYCAAHPLTKGKAINVAKPLPLTSPYRKSGERIIRIAQNLTRYRAKHLSEQRALRASLWAVILCLLDVVPRVPGVGTLILDCLADCQPSTAWSDSRSLLGSLLCQLASRLKATDAQTAPFSLVRPNDLHQLVFRAVDLVYEFLRAPSERLVPTTPLLTAALTLDLHRVIHVLWSRKTARGIATSFEVWSFTAHNIKTMLRILEPSRRELLASPDPARGCAALLFHLNILDFVKPLLRRRPNVSLPYWTHESAELFAALLQQLLLPQMRTGFRCAACQEAFQEPRFKEQAERIANWSGGEKTRLIHVANEYGVWLRSGCLRLFGDALQVPRQTRLLRPSFVIRGSPPKPRVRLPSYAVACRGGEVLAWFLPALGQIWIMPDCPDSLLTQVLSHEITHHNQCVMNPSQYVHLRALLLDRPLPHPDCLNDIVEAGYILGLTLAAGLGPSAALFPPAPRRTKQLAARIARLAIELAKTAHPQDSSARPEVEAAHALLMLLWHVVPARPGLGNAILARLEQLSIRPGWQSRSELWPTLHVEMQKSLRRDPIHLPLTLMSPMEPHRAVAEMLIFLSHVLSPIPERAQAVMACFPVLLEVLTFGSLSVIPVIRLVEKPSRIEARISIIRPTETSEAVIKTVVDTQTRLLQQCRQTGMSCHCLEYLVDVLQRTAPYRNSDRPRRVERCVQLLLEQFDVASFSPKADSCPLCARHLKDPTVQSALQSIEFTLTTGRTRLLNAARSYGEWLQKGCMGMLRGYLELEKPLSPIREFSSF